MDTAETRHYRSPYRALPCHFLDLPGPGAMTLDSGEVLDGMTVAYRTYGNLNAEKSNAVLVFHALTGDQFVAERHPVTGRSGWWALMVGPGRPIDTDRFFVICANVLGGCLGSSGPLEPHPERDEPWGLNFPVITIADMVRAQVLLLDHLGIGRLLCAVGGSMGGMLTLQLASAYPDRVQAVLPIATSARHTAQNIAFDEIGRQAIMADPEWCGGRYLTEGKTPRCGLSVARMVAHVTYLSEAVLAAKFGRRLQDRKALTFGFDADFQVESYLRYQGSTFVDRFDSNSYLYITRAMDYFDLAADHGGSLSAAFRHSKVRFCLASFSSDWLFPTSESKAIVRALSAALADVSFFEIETDSGHDAFLLNEPEFLETVHAFLNASAERAGLPTAALCGDPGLLDPDKDRIS
ncbi:MAG: homoserine O-acetyltransferase [Rhodospirillales bacterium]|nr:homoserine O-acetyltransferase [Rhodospirillales bacterium]